MEDFFWLSLPEAATKLGVSTKTLRRLVLANEIPHYRIGKSNRIRFQAGDLEQYIANSRVERVARTG